MEQENKPEHPQPDSPFRGSWPIFLLGGISLYGYLVIASIAGEPLRPASPDSAAITKFLVVMGVLFACYWFLISPLVRGKRMDPRHLWFAIAFSLLFRAVLLPTDLILENDIYRYMWDGHTSLQRINPYRYAPLAPETEPYRTEYWSKINYPYIPTIYPPTLQYVFFISESLYPGSIIGMKLILLVFDIGTIFVLITILQTIRRPPEWSLLYAWSPLVIKEVANSGHADVVSAFFLSTTLLLLLRKKTLTSSLSLAALVLTKFFGVLFLPLLHGVWKWRVYFVFLISAFVLYLPFLSLDVNPLRGFLTFSQEWQFNAFFYVGVERFLNNMGGEASLHSDYLARLFLFACILIVGMWQTIRLAWKRDWIDLVGAMFIVMAALLLCSPVINTWYLVWMIPLLCLIPSRAWILFSGLILLSYTYYYDHRFPAWLKTVEFGLFFVFLIPEWLFPKIRWGFVGEDGKESAQALKEFSTAEEVEE